MSYTKSVYNIATIYLPMIIVSRQSEMAAFFCAKDSELTSIVPDFARIPRQKCQQPFSKKKDDLIDQVQDYYFYGAGAD